MRRNGRVLFRAGSCCSGGTILLLLLLHFVPSHIRTALIRLPSATLHTHGAEEEQTCNANERLSFIAATAYTHRRRRGLPESPLIHPLPQTARKHPVFLAGKDANIVVEEGKRRGKILSISSRDLRGFTSTLLGTERSGAKAKESFYVEKKFSINFRTRILAFFLSQ